MAGIRGVWAVVGVLACAVLGMPVHGQTLPVLSGPVLLTVTGLDPAQHADGQLAFDLGMLQALPQETISTTSIWTEGVHSFTGVPMSALAAYLQVADVTLSLHAINDYSVEMPLKETEPKAPILAYWMDGAPMPVRDKGPIWLIYPYDMDAKYRTDTAYTRSVWQLDRIDILR